MGSNRLIQFLRRAAECRMQSLRLSCTTFFTIFPTGNAASVSRRSLHSEYQHDALLEKAFSNTDRQFAALKDYANRLMGGETVTADVVLVTSLDSFGGSLDSLRFPVCAEDEGRFASYGLYNLSTELGRTLNGIQKEIYAYSEKFEAHVLATTNLADANLGPSSDWKTAGTNSEQNSKNGAGWMALSPRDRSLYVTGYFVGYLQGSMEGAIAGGQAAFNYKGDVAAAKIDSAKLSRLQTEIRDQIGTGKHKFKNTVEIEDGITAFYRNSLNQSVCWHDAYKFSAMLLSGDAPTEQDLDAARKAGAESGCK
jgi:hypothetical protein